MDIKNEKILSITLKDDEVAQFKSVIKKCNAEATKIGFNKNILFDEDEKGLLKSINKTVNKL